MIPENAPGRGSDHGAGKVPLALSKANDDPRVARAEHALQPLLRPRQVQELLGLSARSVWGFTASGALPSVKLGNSVRYREDDVLTFISKNARRLP